MEDDICHDSLKERSLIHLGSIKTSKVLLPITSGCLDYDRGDEVSITILNDSVLKEKAFYMPLDSLLCEHYSLYRIEISATPINNKTYAYTKAIGLLTEVLLARERNFKLLQQLSLLISLVTLPEDLTKICKCRVPLRCHRHGCATGASECQSVMVVTH